MYVFAMGAPIGRGHLYMQEKNRGCCLKNSKPGGTLNSRRGGASTRSNYHRTNISLLFLYTKVMYIFIVT